MPQSRWHVLSVAIAVVFALVFVGFGLTVLYLTFFASSGEERLSGFERIVASLIASVFLIVVPLLLWWSLKSPRGESAAEATGVADSERPSARSGNSRENEPRAFRGQRPPPDAVVVARMPGALRAVVFLAMAGGGSAMIVGAWTMDSWSARAPEWMAYVLGGIGVFALLGSLHPRNLRSRFMYFFATPAGLYLHADQVSTDSTEWIFIPWANVHDVHETEVAAPNGGRSKAIAFEL